MSDTRHQPEARTARRVNWERLAGNTTGSTYAQNALNDVKGDCFMSLIQVIETTGFLRIAQKWLVFAVVLAQHSPEATFLPGNAFFGGPPGPATGEPPRRTLEPAKSR